MSYCSLDDIIIKNGGCMQTGRFVKLLILFSIFLQLSACGNGGGNGNLVLTLPASVAAGKTINATAVFSSSTARPLEWLTVKYVSDNKDVIPDSTDTNGTNSAGISQVSLPTRNISATAVTVNVHAVVDGVQSNTVSIVVNPAKLTLTPPAAQEVSITSDTTTKLCPGGIIRVVNSGAQIQFTDPSGQNISQHPVTIAVSSITNGTPGDQVILYPNGPSTITIPPYPNSVTYNTDTNGVWFLPIAIDGVSPVGSGGQHVFTVNWLASTQRMGDAGTNISYNVSGQTMLTLACN